jgi:hypothetical protein
MGRHPEFGVLGNWRVDQTISTENSGFVERNVALRLADVNLQKYYYY